MKKLISILLCAALLLSLLTFPTAFAAEEKTPALYLSFDEVVNGAVKDSVGSFDATLMGNAKLAEGLFGNALSLDGVNSYAQLPNGSNSLMGESYSISVWVKMVTNDSATHILDFGNSDSHYCYLAANYPTDNGPRWTLKDNGSKKGATGNVSLLPIGQWTHMAVSCDHGEAKLYVNGNLVSSDHFTENPAQLGTLTRCWLGRSQYSVDPYLNASIDELKIYKEALSEAEIKLLAVKPDQPDQPDEPDEPVERNTNGNIFFACSDVHEYNDGVRDVFGYVVNELKLIPDCALFAGDYCYHVGGNANQTEVQRAEVDAIMKELSPDTRAFYYQGNHDNINAAGLSPSGFAAYNDYYVVYGINLGDVSSSVQKLRTFLEGYNGNSNYAGKPLFIASHCPLDETRRTDHAGGTAPSYISLLNEFGDSIDIVFFFGHSHTEEYDNTFVPRGGTIDPENGVIGDSATLNFTYLNAGFITNKDYAYSSGTSSAGQAHSSALKGPDYNTRVNAPGATAYEFVRRNTTDAAYATEDTVFFWDVTSGCVIEVNDKEIKIDRYGYPADGTKENHPVTKLASYSVSRAVSSCTHTYDEVITAATCLNGGYTTYTCSKCGHSYVTDRVDALGHDWDDGTVTVEPTDTTPGVLTIACRRCDATKTKRLPRKNATVPEDIDFTDSTAVDQFEIVNKDVTAIRNGEGLYMITTKDGFEPANDQLTGDAATTPKDLVLVPVDGDWQATLKFDFNTAGASNGYYQFFGFYAMEDYQNCAGIRGGDGAIQDFIRKDGAITHETMSSEPGLASNGTYWFRIVKEGTTYTCYRSADGEEFTEMFAYADTGIEADKIAIDAYTGMTEGYSFLLKSLTFEDVGGGHVHSYAATVIEPTCTEGGYTTYICTCGDSYVADEVAALGHDLKEVTVAATCTADGSTTLTCSRCDYKKVTEIPALGHDLTEVTVEATCTETGSITETCARCDYEKVTEIPALGHTYINGICQRCGDMEIIEGFFEDVLPDTFCFDAVKWAVDNKITNGVDDGIFAPGNAVTRGHIVTFLWRAAGCPEPTATTNFADLKEGAFYTKAVAWAVEKGITDGVGENKFAPESICTRGQIVTFLWRYMGEPEATKPAIFSDLTEDGFYVDAVAWAVEAGITTGITEELFKPKNDCTRAQAVTFLYRTEQKKA